MTCEWRSLTGVECAKPATRVLHDFEHDSDTALCEEHYAEFMRDRREQR